MKWFEEVTKELISDYKSFAWNTMLKYCSGKKVVASKVQMNTVILTSQYRGAVSVLDELLERSKKEGPEDLLANIHIMRMNLWNEACQYSSELKKISLETAMDPNPDLNVLLKNPSIMGESHGD